MNKDRLKALGLATLLTIGAASLSGCNNKRDVYDGAHLPYQVESFKGSRLENVYVVTFENGEQDIAKVVGTCDESKYSKFHYVSLNTGAYYADGCSGQDWDILNTVAFENREIYNVEDLLSYITTDDLNNYDNRKLTDNDIIAIVNARIQEKANEAQSDNALVRTRK